jgi:hypothetical protein
LVLEAVGVELQARTGRPARESPPSLRDEPLVLDVGAVELAGIKPAERARAAVILTGELKNLPRIPSARTPPTPAAMSVVVNAL